VGGQVVFLRELHGQVALAPHQRRRVCCFTRKAAALDLQGSPRHRVMAQCQATTVRGCLPESWHRVELRAACSNAVLREHGSFVEELLTSSVCMYRLLDSVVQSVKSLPRTCSPASCNLFRNAFFDRCVFALGFATALFETHVTGISGRVRAMGIGQITWNRADQKNDLYKNQEIAGE